MCIEYGCNYKSSVLKLYQRNWIAVKWTLSYADFVYDNVRGNQVKCLNGCGHCIQKKSGIVICHCINMWEGGIRLSESIWKYFWYNIHELLKHGCCISFYFMRTFCDLWVRKPAGLLVQEENFQITRHWSYRLYVGWFQRTSFSDA